MLKKQENAYWCIVKDRSLYLENQSLPFGCAKDLNFDTAGARLIGHYQNHPVYWLEAPEQADSGDFYSQRELLSVEPELFQLAGRATQLSHMLHTQQFCPQCGAQCHYGETEVAMVCSGCHTPHYPRVSPCVIVAVRKDDKILLAQHPRHKTGMYTVIAGFVEAGETLEQCVAREIKEETGIEVENIRYFGSQPWAFPSNLMMAFLADYAGGALRPDYAELTDALWATAETLPEVAPKGTIARSLIDHTLILMAGSQA
ncbi:NAD(+) diphosphatase [Photobacterium aphoticum]|uniref:NAD-capped RNA hydrolase NudC n=1 Tax=Photobacterium aphoticum TaxID=754436 RepID=A0A0J1GLW2_9GAMM|nr:NAD(+) diphosphatase [Photobacterium aphoticum]KLV00688.1 NADH pyrophosphatase [Photobacterium aphoticum]PSU54633.1 NAD(+) diphosphatase [Photobacterium aphoticum]